MVEGMAGLDSPALRARLRTQQSRRSDYERRFVGHARGNVISDIRQLSPTPAQLSAAKPPLQIHGSSHPVGRAMPPKIKIVSPDIRPPASRQPQVASTALHTRKAPSLVLKRQGVGAPQLHVADSKLQLRSLLNVRKLTTVAAVLVVLGGLGIGLHGLKVNKDVAAETTKLTATVQTTGTAQNDAQTGDIPSETPAADPAKHTVATNLPRTITIDKIGVKARVVRLGVKANNQLAVPANIFDAGWYAESSKPGEAGAMVIDGHVSGPTKPGVFYKLHTLAAGDQIKVDRGDGKMYVYKVVKKTSYAADKVDMTAVLTPVTKGKPGLNLITCSGEIDRASNHYKDRTVVFAEQI